MAGILATTAAAATIGVTTTARAGFNYGSSGSSGSSGKSGSGTSGSASGTVSGSVSPSSSGENCFLRGTKILTENGERAIETLAPGDMVRTVSGELHAVKRVTSWNAERKADRDWTADVAPIKVCRSALAPNVPHRDLYLSPGHALYLDGVLICVRSLVNDRSIVRCSKSEATTLTYFQLDLEDHQVIFAEGAPAESCLLSGMIPFAPIWFEGRKSELASRLRSAISPWVDRRGWADKVRDRLDARGDSDLAA
jgi:hypothetical protein